MMSDSRGLQIICHRDNLSGSACPSNPEGCGRTLSGNAESEDVTWMSSTAHNNNNTQSESPEEGSGFG
jgi:hypothetical protein